MAEIINGKEVAEKIYVDLEKRIGTLAARGVKPGLAVVLVGDDPASRVYVNMKKKACARLGLYSEEHKLPAATTQSALIDLVARLNADKRIHGILVQLPLPCGLDEKAVLNTISPEKDVDGFHPVNVGRLMVGDEGFIPCTPAGIIELIRRSGMEMSGKNAVVVGRSNIVGKPVAILLLREHATVTICHSRTRDLPAVCRAADILVVAIGRPEMITGDMVGDGAVVIDVGVNRVGEKLVGDVEFEGASRHASAITPVPGGVGPMTIVMLMQNTVQAAERLS